MYRYKSFQCIRHFKIQKNNFLLIGRAGVDIYPDPPGTKTENANKSFPVFLSAIHVDKKIRVPDAIGMSLKKAIKIISGAGLKLKINGSGMVIYQSPKPGMIVKNNEVCTLTLR